MSVLGYSTERWCWALLFMWVLVVAHGSLWPYDWNFWAAERLQYWQIDTILDVLENVGLFFPAGFLHGWLLRDLIKKYWLIIVHLVWITSFALLLQLLQVHLRSRVPALSDVLFNLLGWCVGFGMFCLFRCRIR